MRRLHASAIREILKTTQMPDVISFAGGLPAPELFPRREFAEALAEVLENEGHHALQYSVTEGLPKLREWICRYLESASGISCSADEILIVSGSQQGLDLIGKVLLDPGDAVVIENPAYLGAIQAFDAYQATYLNVETDDEGMRPDDLVRVLRSSDRKPKFIYVVPNFANPTGVTLSLERRRALLAIAREYGVPIFEDDPYGRLRYSGDPLPPLAALAHGHHVIYMSTVSKIIAPGMRVAWLVMPDHQLYDKVVPAKQAADLHTSSLTQRAVYAYARHPGRVEEHIAHMLPVYRARRDAMLSALAEHMPEGTSWTRPDGGLFLWVRTRRSVDTGAILPEAFTRKVAFVPGAPFWVNADVRNTMRLNFSNENEETIAEGIRRLGGLLRDVA
ncbi:MAG: PLP-dependent aminotransferase family protein [Candidatus Eremiobacteraeota bacterium]|nr:PLP-dependent aminotransferase family protein [Candidatus Eremiobacteraeota bacterium]